MLDHGCFVTITIVTQVELFRADYKPAHPMAQISIRKYEYSGKKKSPQYWGLFKIFYVR